MASLTASQGTALAMVACSLLCWLSPGFLGYVALIPMNTITGHFYVWNLVTAGVADSSPIVGTACAAVVWWGGMKVESLWGFAEMAKYLIIVTIASSVSIFFMCLVAYIAGSEGWFYMYFCGDIGLVAAIFVVLKQVHPDDFVVEGVPFRFKWLPLTAVTVSLLVELVFPTHVPTDAEIGGASLRGTHLLHMFLSTFVAWFYLRFHQAISGTVVGDPSEGFAFKTFFPDVAKPCIAIVADLTFTLVSKVVCGFGKAVIAAEEAAKRKAEEESNPFMSPPATSVADMRRQVALNALHDRLQQAQEGEPSQGLEAFDITINEEDEEH